ncbi:PEGA domain-containing protein [Myxococcus sp. K15C18031901]|uniref:PEGA domain-containing protein n=1 Tax=Myxococcus dinghuensis TaxID=2906761 RepID=UPI0020A7A4CF|nr:PEGA domain-containing protein [Myxococcus dinghuensis]MCP3099497.1 PEGA domain-containing protein [Myxococcus dinghuensis]
MGPRFVVLAVMVSAAGCAGSQEPAALIRAREGLASAERPSGDLALRCVPEDADVYLDGVLQGVCGDYAGTPRGLRLGLGLHQIEVKKQGYWPYTTYYQPSGARARLTIELRTVGASEGNPP